MRKRNFIELEAECWAGTAAPPERAWLAYTQDRPPSLPCAWVSRRNKSFGIEPTGQGLSPADKPWLSPAPPVEEAGDSDALRNLQPDGNPYGPFL